MKKTQQGFTLIELMIVVAIIGILAAVAIPAYKDYIARTQASEASVLLSGLKAPVAEYYNDSASLPDLGDISAIDDGKYVATITADTTNAIYTATYKSSGVAPQIIDKTMSLTYNTSDGKFIWRCLELPTNIQPKNCKAP